MDLEEQINVWLGENPHAKIRFVTQSEHEGDSIRGGKIVMVNYVLLYE